MSIYLTVGGLLVVAIIAALLDRSAGVRYAARLVEMSDSDIAIELSDAIGLGADSQPIYNEMASRQQRVRHLREHPPK